MTGTTLTALKAAQRSLLIKPLDAAVFLAPWPATVPTSFTDNTSTLQPLPAGYQSVGLIDKKSGVAFSRNITAAPIDSYGELQPTRDDITDDVTTLEFEPQQTTALNLALSANVAVSAITGNATNAEVLFMQPSVPQIIYYSAIVIGKDGAPGNEIYLYKVLPKVAVTKYGGETWVPTGLNSQKYTLTAFKDDNAGFAVAHGFGGPGWKKLINTAGIYYPVSALTIPATLSTTHGGAPSLPLVATDQLGNTPTVTWSATGTGGTINATTGVFTPGATASTTATITASWTPPGGGTAVQSNTCAVTVA